MAAVSSHSRLRSTSDPFVDPSSYSALPSKSSTRPQHRPPAPPPKSSRLSSSVSKHTTPSGEFVETVPVRYGDQPARSKMARSQTSLPPTTASSGQRHTASSGRRSHSQDSITAATSAAPAEKGKSAGKHRPKKGSQHADVIDRLDFTGVGTMFHHDGPFDACAPSRNRHRTKAPLFAWGPGQASAVEPDHEYYEPPKKKVDAIAEAWGIHEPEPFEEFSAGGNSRLDGDTPTSSIYAGKEGYGNTSRSKGRRKDTRDMRDYHRDNHSDDGLQMGSRHSTNRTSVIPPPQPVFVPDAQADIEPPLSSARSDGPRRNKSIMQRIRKMRDAPNVPITDDIPTPPSPTSPDGSILVTASGALAPRPTHRSQHSFLGRFSGGRTSTQKDNPTPASESPEAFVYIEDSRGQNKELPPAPSQSPDGEADVSAGSQSPGLGRKGSLLRRVRGVVKGNK